MTVDRRTMLVAGAAAVSAMATTANAATNSRAQSAQTPDPSHSGRTPHRIVTLEEHFMTQSLVDANSKLKSALPARLRSRMNDLGEGRLRDMDENGITVQVISATVGGAELLDGDEGIVFAKAMNDRLAGAVRQHPSRFAGFATLPMRTPEAAADELERAVKQLGFRGALINGLTDGRFLDDARFAPILSRAEALEVPLYLHPNFPPKAVYDAYYAGLPDEGSGALMAGAWGWHSEVGIHILRMALAGTFTKHPGLNMIIGHMGEMLPFMLDRADDMMANQLPNTLERTGMKWTDEGGPISNIILNHVYITTSGVFSTAALSCALETFGADRIMFSVDYPYSSPVQARRWLDSLALSPSDWRKITYANADRILKLNATP